MLTKDLTTAPPRIQRIAEIINKELRPGLNLKVRDDLILDLLDPTVDEMLSYGHFYRMFEGLILEDKIKALGDYMGCEFRQDGWRSYEVVFKDLGIPGEKYIPYVNDILIQHVWRAGENDTYPVGYQIYAEKVSRDKWKLLWVCNGMIIKNPPAPLVLYKSKLAAWDAIEKKSPKPTSVISDLKNGNVIHFNRQATDKADLHNKIGDKIFQIECVGKRAKAILMHPNTWEELRNQMDYTHSISPCHQTNLTIRELESRGNEVNETMLRIVDSLTRLDFIYKNASPERKRELLQVIFPDGFSIEKASGKVRTGAINYYLSAMCEKSGSYEHIINKKGLPFEGNPTEGGYLSKVRTDRHLYLLKKIA